MKDERKSTIYSMKKLNSYIREANGRIEAAKKFIEAENYEIERMIHESRNSSRYNSPRHSSSKSGSRRESRRQSPERRSRFQSPERKSSIRSRDDFRYSDDDMVDSDKSDGSDNEIDTSRSYLPVQRMPRSHTPARRSHTPARRSRPTPESEDTEQSVRQSSYPLSAANNAIQERGFTNVCKIGQTLIVTSTENMDLSFDDEQGRKFKFSTSRSQK